MFGAISIDQIDDWAFVPGSPGTLDLIGFDAINSAGSSPSATAIVIAQQGNNPEKGFDTQSNLSGKGSDIKKLGYSFVVRYYDYTSPNQTGTIDQLSNAPKVLTSSEISDLSTTNGIDIATVFEFGGADESKTPRLADLDYHVYYTSNGGNQGTYDARQALNLANNLTQTPGSPIYFAVDFDPGSQANLTTFGVLNYFQEIDAEFNKDRKSVV